MDTIVEIKAEGAQELTTAAIRKAMQEINRVDDQFGYDNSRISILNTEKILKDVEVYGLITQALDIHEASGGALSLSLRPVLDAWGFTGTHAYRLPTEAELLHWKNSPAEDGITLDEDGRTIRLTDGLTIDLGAIAKGYAADMGVKAMQEAGIRNGLINAGGDITAFGQRSWKIGIKNPRGAGIIAAIPVSNRAIATSGDYERYLVADGQRYCHILDPATGFSPSDYISATAIASSGAVADAWATALFVKGPDRLAPALQKRGIDWIVIHKNGTIRSSSAIKKYLPDSIPVN